MMPSRTSRGRAGAASAGPAPSRRVSSLTSTVTTTIAISLWLVVAYLVAQWSLRSRSPPALAAPRRPPPIFRTAAPFRDLTLQALDSPSLRGLPPPPRYLDGPSDAAFRDALAKRRAERDAARATIHHEDAIAADRARPRERSDAVWHFPSPPEVLFKGYDEAAAAGSSARPATAAASSSAATTPAAAAPRTVPPAGDLWHALAPHIAVVVKTGSDVVADRAERMRRFWFHEDDFPNILWVSDDSHPQIPLLSLPTLERNLFMGLSPATFHLDPDTGIPQNTFKGGWAGDKDKNLPAFLALYHKFPSARFYLMIDDDTYPFLHNVAATIYPIWHDAYTRPQWGGNLFRISCRPWDRSGTTFEIKNPLFAHGGSGILLNNAAVRFLVPAIPECVSRYSVCWAGDMMLAACLHEVGLPCNLRMRHFVGEPPSASIYSKKLSHLWTTDAPVGTLHKLSLAELEAVSAFHAAHGPYNITFRALREHLLRHIPVNRTHPAAGSASGLVPEHH